MRWLSLAAPYFHVSNRRVAPYSLLASEISAHVSELHHLHGFGKALVMIARDRKAALPLSERLPDEKKQRCILFSYTYDMDHSRCGSELC